MQKCAYIVVLVISLSAIAAQAPTEKLYKRYQQRIDPSIIINTCAPLGDRNSDTYTQFIALTDGALFRLELIQNDKKFVFPSYYAAKEKTRINSIKNRVCSSGQIRGSDIATCALFANPSPSNKQTESITLMFEYNNKNKTVVLTNGLKGLLAEYEKHLLVISDK